MAEEYFPFDSGPGADSTEARWRRMARLWSLSGVVGTPPSDAYNLTISGMTATITRKASTGTAEAWVDGFMHRLITADWSTVVPAETTANPRIDRIVLRLNATLNTVVLARLQGTAAASPTAPALTQVDNGIWEIPLWRFTVPASSGAPLASPVDERTYVGPDNKGGSQIVAHGSMSTTQAVAANGNARILGGLNVSVSLIPGLIYEVSMTHNQDQTGSASIRAILGGTAPTSSTGTAVSAATNTPTSGSSATYSQEGQFTVVTGGTYTLSPFLTAPSTSSNNFAPTPTGTSRLTVKTLGPASTTVGTTPLAVP